MTAIFVADLLSAIVYHAIVTSFPEISFGTFFHEISFLTSFHENAIVFYRVIAHVAVLSTGTCLRHEIVIADPAISIVCRVIWTFHFATIEISHLFQLNVLASWKSGPWNGLCLCWPIWIATAAIPGTP